MADETVTLAIHGEVSIDAFAEAMAHWRTLVESITRTAAPGRAVTWVISDLAAGSATVTVRAHGEVEAAPSVAREYMVVGRTLAAGKLADLPSGLRKEAVALARVIDREQVEYLRFETSEFDAIIRANFDREIERAAQTVIEAPAALGGVQGRIQTLTSRNGLRFTLFDTLFDRAVGCYLREGQEEMMRDAWGQMGVVEGIVSRDPITGRPIAIRDVRNVTPTREVAPDAYRAARGAVRRGATDRREPEELISAARDE